MLEKETLFREKAKKYLVCFNESCSLHAQCLRWEVGKYYDHDIKVVTCVSPVYSKVAEGKCALFCDNTPIRMPIGMKNFYYNMPAHTATAIKKDLIESSCRATYYNFHSGRRPITPEVQELIERTCRKHGWNEPLQYDGETEDYLW